YFLSPIDSEDSVYFHEYRKNPFTLLKVFERSFYSPEGFIKARRIAKKTNPDVAYVLHFLNKMSPSIIDGFKSVRVPVVVRLSDFGLICPQALCLGGEDICEKCLSGSLLNSVFHKCIKNSYMGSFVKAVSWYFHRMIGSISRIDAFVSPSKFLAEKFIEVGFPREKFFHIPTFVESSQVETTYTNKGDILYFGRISKEKGTHILLKAYDEIRTEKPTLRVIGDITSSEYSIGLVKKYSDHVKFEDFMPQKSLFERIKEASFIVVPSICYDNMPNVILESFVHGKPVVAASIGSFPELIDDRITGLLFDAGSVEDLTEKLMWAIDHQDEVKEMGKNARKYVEDNHSPKIHYDKLMNVFSSV
ncbi:MAG: glycosyltransferase family 4 protein, partial [Thermodesulfobacteriota bacterium]|nr:glycosyltransferase family 4 protein [Thermodesulfobacteriota bacterium]